LSLEWLYGFDELNSYRLDTKKGKERLEAQIKNLPGLLALAGIEFSKSGSRRRPRAVEACHRKI
jgi:hypothetical protein